MNVETGQYIQELLRNSSNVALGSSELSYTLSVSGSTILFSNSSRYMMVNNGNVGSTTTRNDTKRNFKIYKVIENRVDNEKQDIPYSTPIILTTIDPISQQSSPATAIKRNDYINVLVTVSYNPVAGKFEFKVEDWHNGGGNVEFN